MTCAKCPCPDVCLQWAGFCEWAAKEPTDAVEIKTICNRSRNGPAKVDPNAPASFPPVRQQAMNLWRSAKAFIKSGGKLASKAERARRQSICQACPFWSGSRCRKCGCTALKLYAEAAVCPDSPPRW